MGLETGTYISDLDPLNPDGNDGKQQGDNHLRLIKNTLLNTFPGIDGAVTVTQAELNWLAGVTSQVIDQTRLAAASVSGNFTSLQVGGVDVVLVTRDLIAGAGLTGGGALSADRTFNVGQGVGIAVNADDVALSHLGIEALTDPGADTVLMWDDSVGAAAWLTLSTGFTISGTSVTVNPTQINHDSLAGFVANEHIDHSGLNINPGVGLAGGGALTTSRTLSLSHLGLETLTDPGGDRIAFWDDSAGTFAWLNPSTGLNLSGTSLTVLQASESVSGKVELASVSETVTGTDATRALTPNGFAGTKSLASTGYYVLPGGLTFQWGVTGAISSGTSISLPRTFTTAYTAVATPIGSSVPGGADMHAVVLTNTTLTIYHAGYGGPRQFYWQVNGIS